MFFDLEELRNAAEKLAQAWSEFSSTMRDVADALQKLFNQCEELEYTKLSIPPRQYGTRKKKDHLFRNQILPRYQASRKMQKHYPYCKRVY